MLVVCDVLERPAWVENWAVEVIAIRVISWETLSIEGWRPPRRAGGSALGLGFGRGRDEACGLDIGKERGRAVVVL